MNNSNGKAGKVGGSSQKGSNRPSKSVLKQQQQQQQQQKQQQQQQQQQLQQLQNKPVVGVKRERAKSSSSSDSSESENSILMLRKGNVGQQRKNNVGFAVPTDKSAKALAGLDAFKAAKKEEQRQKEAEQEAQRKKEAEQEAQRKKEAEQEAQRKKEAEQEAQRKKDEEKRLQEEADAELQRKQTAETLLALQEEQQRKEAEEALQRQKVDDLKRQQEAERRKAEEVARELQRLQHIADNEAYKKSQALKDQEKEKQRQLTLEKKRQEYEINQKNFLNSVLGSSPRNSKQPATMICQDQQQPVLPVSDEHVRQLIANEKFSNGYNEQYKKPGAAPVPDNYLYGLRRLATEQGNETSLINPATPIAGLSPIISPFPSFMDLEQKHIFTPMQCDSSVTGSESSSRQQSPRTHQRQQDQTGNQFGFQHFGKQKPDPQKFKQAFRKFVQSTKAQVPTSESLALTEFRHLVNPNDPRLQVVVNEGKTSIAILYSTQDVFLLSLSPNQVKVKAEWILLFVAFIEADSMEAISKCPSLPGFVSNQQHNLRKAIQSYFSNSDRDDVAIDASVKELLEQGDKLINDELFNTEGNDNLVLRWIQITCPMTYNRLTMTRFLEFCISTQQLTVGIENALYGSYYRKYHDFGSRRNMVFVCQTGRTHLRELKPLPEVELEKTNMRLSLLAVQKNTQRLLNSLQTASDDAFLEVFLELGSLEAPYVQEFSKVADIIEQAVNLRADPQQQRAAQILEGLMANRLNSRRSADDVLESSGYKPEPETGKPAQTSFQVTAQDLGKAQMFKKQCDTEVEACERREIPVSFINGSMTLRDIAGQVVNGPENLTGEQMNKKIALTEAFTGKPDNIQTHWMQSRQRLGQNDTDYFTFQALSLMQRQDECKMTLWSYVATMLSGSLYDVEPGVNGTFISRKQAAAPENRNKASMKPLFWHSISSVGCPQFADMLFNAWINGNMFVNQDNMLKMMPRNKSLDQIRAQALKTSQRHQTVSSPQSLGVMSEVVGQDNEENRQGSNPEAKQKKKVGKKQPDRQDSKKHDSDDHRASDQRTSSTVSTAFEPAPPASLDQAFPPNQNEFADKLIGPDQITFFTHCNLPKASVQVISHLRFPWYSDFLVPGTISHQEYFASCGLKNQVKVVHFESIIAKLEEKDRTLRKLLAHDKRLKCRAGIKNDLNSDARRVHAFRQFLHAFFETNSPQVEAAFQLNKPPNLQNLFLATAKGSIRNDENASLFDLVYKFSISDKLLTDLKSLLGQVEGLQELFQLITGTATWNPKKYSYECSVVTKLFQRINPVMRKCRLQAKSFGVEEKFKTYENMLAGELNIWALRYVSLCVYNLVYLPKNPATRLTIDEYTYMLDRFIMLFQLENSKEFKDLFEKLEKVLTDSCNAEEVAKHKKLLQQELSKKKHPLMPTAMLSDLATNLKTTFSRNQIALESMHHWLPFQLFFADFFKVFCGLVQDLDDYTTTTASLLIHRLDCGTFNPVHDQKQNQSKTLIESILSWPSFPMESQIPWPGKAISPKTLSESLRNVLLQVSASQAFNLVNSKTVEKSLGSMLQNERKFTEDALARFSDNCSGLYELVELNGHSVDDCVVPKIDKHNRALTKFDCFYHDEIYWQNQLPKIEEFLTKFSGCRKAKRTISSMFLQKLCKNGFLECSDIGLKQQDVKDVNLDSLSVQQQGTDVTMFPNVNLPLDGKQRPSSEKTTPSPVKPPTVHQIDQIGMQVDQTTVHQIGMQVDQTTVHQIGMQVEQTHVEDADMADANATNQQAAKTQDVRMEETQPAQESPFFPFSCANLTESEKITDNDLNARLVHSLINCSIQIDIDKWNDEVEAVVNSDVDRKAAKQLKRTKRLLSEFILKLFGTDRLESIGRMLCILIQKEPAVADFLVENILFSTFEGDRKRIKKMKRMETACVALQAILGPENEEEEQNLYVNRALQSLTAANNIKVFVDFGLTPTGQQKELSHQTDFDADYLWSFPEDANEKTVRGTFSGYHFFDEDNIPNSLKAAVLAGTNPGPVALLDNDGWRHHDSHDALTLFFGKKASRQLQAIAKRK